MPRDEYLLCVGFRQLPKPHLSQAEVLTIHIISKTSAMGSKFVLSYCDAWLAFNPIQSIIASMPSLPYAILECLITWLCAIHVCLRPT